MGELILYQHYLDPSIRPISIQCRGQACLDTFKKLEQHQPGEIGGQVKRLWILRMRAGRAFPEGLLERWQVQEEHRFRGGILNVLTPKNGAPSVP